MNKKIQLSTNIDGQATDVYPVTKPEFVEFNDGKTLLDKLNKGEDSLDATVATPVKDGLMSKEDKAKLDTMKNYVHPGTHPATLIIQDETHRFITDDERVKWNNKADSDVATTLKSGLMSAKDKQKLDSLIDGTSGASNANIEQNTKNIQELSNAINECNKQQYSGEDIRISNTIKGQASNVILSGKTIKNLVVGGQKEYTADKSINEYNRIQTYKLSQNIKPDTTYYIYVNVTNIENAPQGLYLYGVSADGSDGYGYITVATTPGWTKLVWKTQAGTPAFNKVGLYLQGDDYNKGAKATWSNFMLFEEDVTLDNVCYVDGIQSTGYFTNNTIEIYNRNKNISKTNRLVIERRGEHHVKLETFPFDPDAQYTISCDNYVVTDAVDDWTPMLGIAYEDGSVSEAYLIHSKKVESNVGKKIKYFYYRNP